MFAPQQIGKQLVFNHRGRSVVPSVFGSHGKECPLPEQGPVNRRHTQEKSRKIFRFVYEFCEGEITRNAIVLAGLLKVATQAKRFSVEQCLFMKHVSTEWRMFWPMLV